MEYDERPANNRFRGQHREVGSRFEFQLVPAGGVLLLMVDPIETTAMHLSPAQAEAFVAWMKRLPGK